MNLILSSCDFRNEKSRNVIFTHLPKPIEQCRLLFIPNEKATFEAIHSEKFYRRMQEFGFARESTIVFDYYNPTKYFDLDIDVLYISGGNTLKTLDRIRKSGFDKEIIRYIQSGVTYIGGSAGAHIATQNVSHTTRYDEAPEDMTDFSGLRLFDGIFICHFTAERQEHYEQLLQENQYKVYTLSDEDSIVIAD